MNKMNVISQPLDRWEMEEDRRKWEWEMEERRR